MTDIYLIESELYGYCLVFKPFCHFVSLCHFCLFHWNVARWQILVACLMIVFDDYCFMLIHFVWGKLECQRSISMFSRVYPIPLDYQHIQYNRNDILSEAKTCHFISDRVWWLWRLPYEWCHLGILLGVDMMA